MSLKVMASYLYVPYSKEALTHGKSMWDGGAIAKVKMDGHRFLVTIDSSTSFFVFVKLQSSRRFVWSSNQHTCAAGGNYSECITRSTQHNYLPVTVIMNTSHNNYNLLLGINLADNQSVSRYQAVTGHPSPAAWWIIVDGDQKWDLICRWRELAILHPCLGPNLPSRAVNEPSRSFTRASKIKH